MRLRIWQGSITADMADLMWMAGYVGDYPAVQETKVFTGDQASGWEAPSDGFGGGGSFYCNCNFSVQSRLFQNKHFILKRLSVILF